MPLSSRLDARIAAQMAARRDFPGQARIKVNLYTPMELAAVAAAARNLGLVGARNRIDCVMVADSYLMTHLGRASTRLESAAEQGEFLDLMVRLVADMRAALDREFTEDDRPWMIGDLPDGALDSRDRAVAAALRMAEAGAETVKAEIASDEVWEYVEAMVRLGIRVVAHIGYTPQSRDNVKFGDNLAEALDLCAQARRARDAGASALVVERVAQPVNAALCRPSPQGLPVYSIFSGWVPFGGQSLNVFDSVVRHPGGVKAFPPTASIDRADYPEAYTQERVERDFTALLKLAAEGMFPKKGISLLDEDSLARLESMDPWR